MVALEKIRLASRAYDGTLPILRGHATIPGFQFEITETEDVPGRQTGAGALDRAPRGPIEIPAARFPGW